MRGSRDYCLEQLIFKARSSKSSIVLFKLYKIVEEFRKIELHHLQFLVNALVSRYSTFEYMLADIDRNISNAQVL